MSYSPLTNFQLRFVATILIGVVTLLIGLLWLGEQTPSWAAPAQNPNLQTIPPRPPDDDPTPEPPDSAPLPPGPARTAEPPASPPEKDKDDSDHDNDAPPVQPTEKKGHENQDESQPTQPPKQKDHKGQDQALPAQTPERGSGQGQDLPLKNSTPVTSAQADLSLSETVSNALPNIGEAITSTSPSTSDSASTVALPEEASSPNWLYTLGLAVILVLSGIFLVNQV